MSTDIDGSYFIQYKNAIRPLLDAIDEVRETLEDIKDIDLPQMVVVGDQSSGKSSVLESISQVNLPSGEGCVTRAPLELQLRNLPKDKKEYAVISGNESSEQIHDLNEIGTKILNFQEYLVGKENNITKTKIVLKLHKHEVPNLTLVDLPGLAYENKAEAATIRDIINEYCSQKNSIILLVVNAGQELVTCEASLLAAAYDKHQNRRITVITKADIAESGINKRIKDYMSSGSLGVVAVRNRTQQERQRGDTHLQAREKEQHMFQKRKHLQCLPKQSKGTVQLIKLITKIQGDIVVSNIGDIQRDILSKIDKIELQLNTLPTGCVTDFEKHCLLQQMCQSLEQEFRSLCEGNYDEQQNINFNMDFHNNIQQLKDELVKLSKSACTLQYLECLKVASANDAGSTLPNFPSQKPILPKLRVLINKAQPIGLVFIDQAINFVQHVLELLVQKHFEQYQDLQDLVQQMSQKILDQQKQVIVQQFQNYMKCEQCAIDPASNSGNYLEFVDKLKDYDFGKKSERNKVLVSVKQKDEYGQCIAKQMYQPSILPATLQGYYYDGQQHAAYNKALVLRQSILAYWITVCVPRITDMLQITLRSTLVKYLVDEYRPQVEQQLSPLSESKFQEKVRQMLDEPVSIAIQRHDLQKQIQMLKQAQQILQNATKGSGFAKM